MVPAENSAYFRWRYWSARTSFDFVFKRARRLFACPVSDIAPLAFAKDNGRRRIVKGHEIDNHRIDAAGFGDERNDQAGLFRQRAVDRLGDLKRPGEDDAGASRMGDESRANLAAARQELQRGPPGRPPR